MKPRNNEEITVANFDPEGTDQEKARKLQLKVRNSISHKRNQATKRLIKQIKGHQKATGYKVLVNFLHTWPRGHDHTFTSKNWGKTDPFIEKTAGASVVSQDNNLASGDIVDSDNNLPDSEQFEVRDPAVAASGYEKTGMRTICQRCMEVKKPTDKIGSWIKCGRTGCHRLNCHAKCNSIHLPNIRTQSQLNKFCRETIRCSLHMGKTADPVIPGQLSDFEISEDSNRSLESESDFETQQRPKKKKKLKKVARADNLFSDSQTVKPSCKSKNSAALKRKIPDSAAGKSKTTLPGKFYLSKPQTSEAIKPSTPADRNPVTSTISKPRTPSVRKLKTPTDGKPTAASVPRKSATLASNPKTVILPSPSIRRGAKDVLTPGPANLPSSDEFSDPLGGGLSRRQRNKHALKKYSADLVSNEPSTSDASDKSWADI